MVLATETVQLHPGHITNGYKMLCIKGLFPFKYDFVFGVSNVKISGGGGVVNHPNHSSFGISEKQIKKVAFNPDGNVATFGFVKSLRKSAHHSFRISEVSR